LKITKRDYQQKALNELKKYNKGKLIFPTGAGKTFIMMEDAKERILNSNNPLNFVIVSPKILLATQLASEFKHHLGKLNFYISFVHSGEDGTTDVNKIKSANNLIRTLGKHHLMFTTYKSLPKINDSEIPIDYCYFDEAHHSTEKLNFVGVADTSRTSKNCFFFTATVKHNDTNTSMCNSLVYGTEISSISAKELVDAGHILPPKVVSYEASDTDDVNIINFIDSIEESHPKILVAIPSTKIMMDMFVETDLLDQLKERDYNVFHITSKYGCVVNGVKVSREIFFSQLNTMGNDNNEKLIIFHHSIIGEGISVNGMSHALILRNLSSIDYIQTIGRLLRLHKEDSYKLQKGFIKPGEYDKYKKPYGIIAFPSKNSRGIKIERKLQLIVNAIFVEGKQLIV
jgi:superfamily II DNA or RNA helicase